MVDPRLTLALLVGKIIGLTVKIRGSGATAAPGLIALKIDPNLITKLTKKFDSIIVTGTNGKTTTSRLIFDLLKDKYKIIHNRQGSNLMRGLASTLIGNANLLGKINFDLGLWEVDEAVAPIAIKSINSKTILFLNLFRDQLDRYGEVDTVRQLWADSLSTVSGETSVVLNADDPGVYFLKTLTKAKITTFGISDTNIKIPNIAAKSDIKHCPVCLSTLIYTTVYSSHLGMYSCSKCTFKRENPDIRAEVVSVKQNFKTSYSLGSKNKIYKIDSNLPGLYNIYNQLAATAAASVLNSIPDDLEEKLEAFNPAFGRFQKINYEGKNIVVFLIKNPTGANEVLRILASQKNLNLLILLNDLLADGTDVSWIWDTSWEIIKDSTVDIKVSGIRAWDMANRLKYAGIDMNKVNAHEDIKYSFESAISSLNKKNTLVVLPTYTALLRLQEYLSQKGNSDKWHSQ